MNNRLNFNHNNYYQPGAFAATNYDDDDEGEGCSNTSTSSSLIRGNASTSDLKLEQMSPAESPSPMMPPEKKKIILNSSPRKLADMMPSSRLSMGMTGKVRDIVAIFPHNELTELEQLRVFKHPARLQRRVFTAKCTAYAPRQKPIDLVGTEDKAGEGYEYVLAFVDRRTGKAVKIEPTALINFQPQFETNLDELLNLKHRKAVDYSADHASTTEQKYAERRRLTTDFGSVRKIKQLDAYMRRSVTNETLAAMTSTAFSSTNIIVKKDDAEEDDDIPREEKKLSILEQVTSSVLPSANLSATSPGEVYTLDQFMPEVSSEILQEIQQEALLFFRQYDSAQKIIGLGISPFVAKRVGIPLHFSNPTRRCCVALKAIALAKLTQIVHKIRGGNIMNFSAKEYRELSIVPPKMLEYITGTYIGSHQKVRGKIHFENSPEQRSRIATELLCLLLLFDDPEYILPITPLVRELLLPETKLKNLLCALGCVVAVASEAQALNLNTIRIARLVGPPEKGSRFRLSDRKGKRKP